MHDLKAIYMKIWKQVKIALKEQLIFGDNIHKYPNPPKLSDVEIISLAITAECLAIDSENLLWSKIKSDYPKKYEHIYLRPSNDTIKLYNGVMRYIKWYKETRRHTALNNQRSKEVYEQAFWKAA